jgi:hypothetical protein
MLAIVEVLLKAVSTARCAVLRAPPAAIQERVRGLVRVDARSAAVFRITEALHPGLCLRTTHQQKGGQDQGIDYGHSQTPLLLAQRR